MEVKDSLPSKKEVSRWNASDVTPYSIFSSAPSYVAWEDYVALTVRLKESEQYAQDREEHNTLIVRGGAMIIAERDRMRAALEEIADYREKENAEMRIARKALEKQPVETSAGPTP